MSENIDKYKETLSQMEILLQDVTHSLSKDKKSDNSYCIIPKINREKRNLKLFITNLSDNTSITMYQSATTQGIKIFDENHNNLFSYVQAIKDGNRNTSLSYADGTNISEKSRFNSSTNRFEPTYIKESYPNKNGIIVNNEYIIYAINDISTRGRLKVHDPQSVRTIEDQLAFQNKMLNYLYLLNSTSIIKNMNVLRKQFVQSIKHIDQPKQPNQPEQSGPDTSDTGENR